MSEAPLPGPLEDFLGNPPIVPASAQIRRNLLRRTAAVVGWRRWRRRLAAAAAVAALVLLTAATLWRLGLGNGQSADPLWPHVEKGPDGPAPPIEKQPEPPAPVPPMPSAFSLEWQAFDAPPTQRASLYQQAGNRYVDEEQDLAAALRCYGQAVQTARTDDLQIDPGDNWLVMALKMDQLERRKEK